MPPSVIGWARVFLRAVFTEIGEKRGGPREKMSFKKVKISEGKNV